MSYDEWKDTAANANNDAYTVLSGHCSDGTNYLPCYWQNGVRVMLAYENSAGYNETRGIVLDGDNTYLCGRYYNGTASNACYWKNRSLVKVDIEDRSQESYIIDLAVSGGVFFLCGHESNGINTHACYWINKTKHALSLPPGITDSYAYGIAVESETFDFYICGYYVLSGTMYACCWKNGGECITLISPATGSVTNTLAISNGNVYIGGFYKYGTTSFPCYWVNGSLINLPYTPVSGAIVYAITIYDGSIYAAGEGGLVSWKESSILWEDSSTTGSLRAISRYDNDLYLAGFKGTYPNCTPYFSKNGSEITLSLPPSYTLGAAWGAVVRAKR